MKNKISIALCAIMMAMCTTALQAQTTEQKESREKLAEAHGKHISQVLALDDATAKKFMETWLDYQKEIWALSPQTTTDKQKPLTDEEIDKAITQRMERSQKLLDIHEKYYKKYRQFLSPKQVERVFELERNDMDRINDRNRERENSRPNKDRADRPGRRTSENMHDGRGPHDAPGRHDAHHHHVG